MVDEGTEGRLGERDFTIDHLVFDPTRKRTLTEPCAERFGERRPRRSTATFGSERPAPCSARRVSTRSRSRWSVAASDGTVRRPRANMREYTGGIAHDRSTRTSSCAGSARDPLRRYSRLKDLDDVGLRRDHRRGLLPRHGLCKMGITSSMGPNQAIQERVESTGSPTL